ncbi:short-chain dehydrogenase (plasmid) [Stanieria sp. NIES-3757]|nr:short-chain dehydrogenase [Stanieria sp. NIES-3757]
MKGKQVLLTGGTGGLGLGVMRVLLAQDAKVTTPYRSERSLEPLQEAFTTVELESIRLVETNLSDEQSLERLVNGMERVDALIHTVGGYSMGKTHEYSFEAWKKDIDLNLNTAFLVCKHSLRRMLEQGYGRIVTVGSRAAFEPGGQLAAYSASKAGVVALTKAIADETKGTNITANVVLPSVIDTPKNRQDMGEENAHLWVTPESLGQVICFLASEAAKDVRGAAVPVYGSA